MYIKKNVPPTLLLLLKTLYSTYSDFKHIKFGKNIMYIYRLGRCGLKATPIEQKLKDSGLIPSKSKMIFNPQFAFIVTQNRPERFTNFNYSIRIRLR